MSKIRNPRTSSIKRLIKVVVEENKDCRTVALGKKWIVTSHYSDGTQETRESGHFPGQNEYINHEMVYTGHRGGRYTWKLNRRRAITLDFPEVDEDAKMVVLF